MTSSVATTIVERLIAAGDPERAVGQQRYMKSAMPFHGVKVPAVRKIVADVVRARPIDDEQQWLDTVLGLWQEATHREERYAAIDVLNHRRHRQWLIADKRSLIETLVTTGAWWDFIDAIAGGAVGAMLANDRVATEPILRSWARHDDFWLRRTAILAQLKAKEATDPRLLRELIEPSMGDRQFFLRKGIGWALRQYSYVDPDWVIAFVNEHSDVLSPLSKREGLKVLLKRGAVTAIP